MKKQSDTKDLSEELSSLSEKDKKEILELIKKKSAAKQKKAETAKKKAKAAKAAKTPVEDEPHVATDDEKVVLGLYDKLNTTLEPLRLSRWWHKLEATFSIEDDDSKLNIQLSLKDDSKSIDSKKVRKPKEYAIDVYILPHSQSSNYDDDKALFHVENCTSELVDRFMRIFETAQTIIYKKEQEERKQRDKKAKENRIRGIKDHRESLAEFVGDMSLNKFSENEKEDTVYQKDLFRAVLNKIASEQFTGLVKQGWSDTVKNVIVPVNYNHRVCLDYSEIQGRKVHLSADYLWYQCLIGMDAAIDISVPEDDDLVTEFNEKYSELEAAYKERVEKERKELEKAKKAEAEQRYKGGRELIKRLANL